MVTKQEVLSEFGVQELDEARNIDLPDEKLEGGSKGELIRLAGQLRNRRNELNQMVSKRASKRGDLDTKAREKVDEAQKHHGERDEINSQVQEHKQSRSELDAKANELFDEVDEIRSGLELDDGKDTDELKEEIKQLEFRQQTEALSIEDEREFVKKIKDKREELRQRKDKVEGSGNLEGLTEEAEEVRSEASQHHQEMTELADDARRHHNQMIEAYCEADDIRDKADGMHELFVKAQKAASRHHEDFVHVQKCLHGLDKKEERQRKDSRVEEREAAKAETEEICQKFEGGETLETEDLTKLQKSGLL